LPQSSPLKPPWATRSAALAFPVRRSSARHRNDRGMHRGGALGEAEANIGLLAPVSAPAAADRDAPLTVKLVKVQENTAEASCGRASSTKCGKSSSFERPVISRLRRLISLRPIFLRPLDKDHAIGEG
jgi:hypothetical protein